MGGDRKPNHAGLDGKRGANVPPKPRGKGKIPNDRSNAVGGLGNVGMAHAHPCGMVPTSTPHQRTGQILLDIAQRRLQ